MMFDASYTKSLMVALPLLYVVVANTSARGPARNCRFTNRFWFSDS